MPRYAIGKEDLQRAALNLQLGEGIADRMNSLDVDEFINEAEEWAENQVEEYIGVPLFPTRARGQSNEDFVAKLETPEKRNFPIDFIQAVLYRSLALLLHSEYFENSPNVSESGKWAQEEAEARLAEFRSKRTNRVGAGRLRHPNPHMPPTIALREEMDRDRPSGGRK